jgi:hypothetical protein
VYTSADDVLLLSPCVATAEITRWIVLCNGVQIPAI